METPGPASAWILILTAAVLASSCRTAPGYPEPFLVQPGAPGAPSRTISAAESVEPAGSRGSAADAAFMRGMIAHHAQALEMARLAAARGSRSEIAVLAKRIELSQGDEIRMMTSWLEARGEEPPASDGHADHGAHGAGMLTPEEMQRLADATGPAFDALFLELMIKHHEGALAMVAELLATPGAAQEPEVFAFASDVEAEQRIEIARMRRMLLEVTNR